MHGDLVYGDKVGGDKVQGNKITVSGSGTAAFGEGATAVGSRGVHVGGNVGGSIITGDNNHVTQGSNPNEIADAFAKIQAAVTIATLNSAQKTFVETAVAKLRTEAEKGANAQEAVVQDWLTTLVQMAPHIGEVAIQTFLNPINGLATVFQKVAQKGQEQQEFRKGK